MSEAEPDPSGNSNSSFYLGKIFQIYCFLEFLCFFLSAVFIKIYSL